MALDGVEHGASQVTRRRLLVGARIQGQRALEPGLVERRAIRAFRFGQAVAVHQQRIAGVELHFTGLVLAGLEHPERNTTAHQPFNGSILPAEQRRCLAGVDELEPASRRGVGREEQRDETRGRRVPADLKIEAPDERG